MDGLASVGGFSDDLDVGLCLQHHAETLARERVVIDKEHADAHVASGMCARTTKP